MVLFFGAGLLHDPTIFPATKKMGSSKKKKQVRMRKNLELFFIEIRVEGLENHDCYIMVPHHLENRPAGWSVPHRIPLLGYQ